MADIHFEIFDNADFGNKNLRFSEAPAQEQRDFLKQSGYGFTTRYGGVWYPRTQEAKNRNADFVKEFAEKFYPGNNKFQSQKQIDHLAEQALENSSAEIKSSSDDRIAYLENLIAELQEERKRDLEKISRLEAALENQNEENSAEIEMQQEQAALDDEAEWEKENTLTDAEEKAYIEKPFETEIPSETIELTSEMLDTLHESAEKEALEEEPQAEKEILHAAEKSDDDLTVSPEDLAIAKSVLPAVQYVSTLKFAQGEEREFFVHKIKEISAAVENAPKIGGTDGLEEHRIVLRYFHPSGTQSFITEIGKDGDAFGFQCLNDDWENAEWGYLNLDELKNIRGMEVDFHVPAGMTVEKFIQKERLEQYSEENVTAEAPKETRITWNDILQAAEGSHWNDEENAVYNNARNQIAEYAKKLGVDIESSESPEEAAETFAAAHEEISFSEDGSLVIDESLKPVYFNDLSDEQKEEVINGYRSADDQQMLEAWQKELENSYEFDKDIATNPPTDEWIANYLSEIKADFNTGYWHDIFSDLEKEENHEKTISDLSATEVSRLSEEKYGFYFEYSDDENVADIYSAKDGDFVGSYGEGGFGYADDLSGNDPTTKIPDENFREVLELAEIFYQKKSDEYENLVEAENGQMMTSDEAHEWNEEQKMQHSQEEDERDAEKADKDFEITKRLDEIVSEIKKSDFTLESKYENSLHSVSLKNKDGKVVFSAKENDNVVIPVEHTIAAWANDEASEKSKSLADEFFNLVCDDGIRGGDYVNAVFKRDVPVEEDYETDLSESNILYTAENYYQVNDRFAIEIVPAERPLSSGKTGDDWTVRFYDIKDSEKFGEKGQFVTSYYASTMLEHRKGTGLSLQGDVPAWTLDAETMDYVHDITFMWVDRHSSVQQKEDTEVSQEEIEQEKAFVQNRIQQLKDELNNPENADDEQQNSEAKKNIENLESLTNDDIKKQVLWRKENQKRNQEAHNQVVEQMMEEKLRNKTPQEGELLSYNEKNPAYSVANKETERETSIQPSGRLDENVKKLGGLDSLSEANGIIEKIKSSGFDILSTGSRIIIFDENKYYDFNAYSDSGYFNYETKKFEFDLDRRNLNEWDFREYIKNGLKITKRMKDFAKIEKQDFSKEQTATNFVLEKLKSTGIEVITDKEEFDRILQREEFLQKMTKSQSPKYLNSEDMKMLKGWGYKTSEDLEQIQTAMLLSDIKLNGKKTGVKKAVEILGREKFLGSISRSAFHSTSANEAGGNYVEFDSSVLFSDKREDFEKLHAAEKESKEHISVLNEIARKESYFQFNEEDSRKFIRKVDEWHKDNTNPRKLIVVGNIPPVMKVLGIAENLIEIEHSTLDKIVRENPLYPDDRQGHELSVNDIYAIPSQLADPVMVFKSRTRKDSYVFFTERRNSNGNSILIPMAANKREGRIVINKITSMYGKDNEIEFVKTNIDEENLIYVDKKRSLGWINEKSSNGKLESQVQFLRQRLTDIETYNLNILTKERLVNFLEGNSQKPPVQKMSVSDGETYGFAYNGKIYLNPDVMNSNVAVHEYTHLWDEYTKKTNPELWQKGKSIFKNTHFWEEVKSDPNYSNIADDDDLVLSEIHSRICGEIAQKVLEHIAEIDGEITKDKAIDWNAETAVYILDLYKKAQPENKLIQNMDASEVKNEIVEFLSMPMKDLMAGKNISVSLSDEKTLSGKDLKEYNYYKENFKTSSMDSLNELLSDSKKFKRLGQQRAIEDLIELQSSKTQNKKDYSLEEYWRNSASGMTMQDVKDGRVHIIDLTQKGTENSAPRTKSSQKKIREQCREILKKTDSEITEEDKKILAQYEGGGGLNEEERTNAEVLNAFYTPDNLIEKVWNLVDAYAPDAKSVLEPSAGVGRFAENRPDNEFTMHELDETSARINKILHPEADVIQGAFQKQFLDDGERFLKIGYEQPKYDVVIGNPPYGKYNDKYKGLGEGREFDRYEEYFIARGLDALKDEKSVLAFVVPSGFLNTASDKQKEIIASKGEILDAYRLPEGTFSTTKVGTDILIMRKKEGIDGKNISGELLSNGEWFKSHPEKILGEVKTRTNQFGKEEEYVVVHEGLSIQDELNKIDIFADEITEKNKSENLFETQLAEYNKKYWGAIRQGDTRYDASPVTEERLSEIKHLSKELSEYFENGIRPENDRFVIGETPRVLQETGSEYTDVTVSVAVIKKAVETHGLSEEEILNALTRLSTPILVFDSDKAATENKADSKLVLTDVFKDEKPVALAVNVNDSVQKQENGHRKQVEVQNIRSIHDRTVVAKNGVDLIQKWTTDGLCRYVDDKKITDWSTIARVQFPIEVLQSADSNILTRTALVNSVFPEQTPLEETEKAEPEKQNPSSPKPKKEKWNIVKSKGDVMSAEEFSHLYGRDFDEREFPIWKATDWQGNIDLAKLSGDDIRYLSESGKYVEKNIGEWTHKELFASGDIYAKIQEQKELYEKSNGNKIFADNIKILESAMKSPLEMERIHFGVKTALAENFKIEHIDAEGNKVNLNLQESFILWAQNAKLSDQKWRGDIDFATANISREELDEELSFYDIVNYIDGKPVKAEPVRGWRTYDMSEEEKAAEKAERKKEADLKRQARSDTANRLFDRYLHEGLSDADKARLAAEYNRRFNSYVAPDYSKLPLFVDGMSAYKGDSKFKLYDQQIKGISFLCNKGNGLLAYDVGVGKTAAGIVATVNQIQTGRSKRPLIVVPNQVYPKWYTDIRQLFPNVKLNDLYNFNSDFVSKYQDKKNPHNLNIPENSISLCTYEALKNITFTDESCENELYEDFASLLSADMDGSARENAESSDKIKGVIGSASHVKDESYFFYEDCGFDNLTVDEAHNFKNLWVVPRPKKKGASNEYAGIPSGKPSARALKMYGMTQLTQRHNDDRNVFMLTATPFTNSPTEVYSMLSYIGRERLKQAGITSLRAFFDEFAQTKQELGVTSTGNIDTKQVMKNWKELSALQNILTEFIDKVDGEEAGIIRPNKFTHVKPLDMSDLQKEMRAIDEERMAEVKEGNSAAVIVAMNNMRLSCVAPALANPAMYPGVELPPLSRLVETSPKLKFVCDAIIDMYKGNPEKGQFMYVPLGKESHGIIKDYLVAHGIPKNAVEIINGEVNNTPEKKEKITSCFNDEKNPCKIIIGGRNTAEGIDLNGNSFVMYNCSLGWNPSETIQAEGRIWRQGNLQGNVHIVYPVMNDSIDSVLYQKHDEKRSRINELWNYKGDSLNVEDINPEDLKLDLIKDPNKKAKLILQEETKEARAELSRLNLKIKSFDEIIEKRKQLELDFSDAKGTVDYQKEQIESYKKSGLEVPEWIKSELKDCNKKFAKAETGLEKVREKLSSLKITDSEKEAEYIRNLNIQKHVCEEKINNIENTLPQILKKLEIERMEQKLIEYPVEKQREILEADILNNLRPMKEVEYEIRTMRHEAMLSEKLKAGEITEKEFSLYKDAGYEKYEKWLNGEIESLEESSVKNEATNENSSIKNENDIEKIIVYYDGHWAEERGEKGKGWKYQEKSFDNPKDALDFYNTAKIPKDVGAENKNGFRFNFMNPEEQLLKMISGQDKTESVQKENVSEKIAAEKPEQKDLKTPAEKTEPEKQPAQTDLKKAAEKIETAKQPEQDTNSLYAEPGSLFFGLGGSDVLSVYSTENEYRKSVPYDDFSITERQLTESELKRDEIIFPVLNGKESGMYKAFKDFAEHGVFDVQGKSVEIDGSGRISETGWNQLQAAMEIYRNKKFETFRYVLIGREDGKIKDQLAVKSYSPNSCAVSAPDSRTIKQVITRAEELDCMIAAVHNHPSGNTIESSFDVDTTEALRKICTKENGQSRFAGHIILDHDTFSLYTPQNGWKLKLNSNAYGNSEDKLLNKNFAFSEDSVDYTWQLENVAKKINDRNSWNDNFIPVVFADSLNHVSGIKLYDKSFFDNEPQKIRNELQFSGLEANSVKAFPVITKNFAETMSAVDELLFEDKLKNLVEHSAFIDAALPESTVTEKFNILPGRQYFDVHGAKLKNPDIEATWQTRINPALFSEPEQKTMRKKEVAFER